MTRVAGSGEKTFSETNGSTVSRLFYNVSCKISVGLVVTTNVTNEGSLVVQVMINREELEPSLKKADNEVDWQLVGPGIAGENGFNFHSHC